MVSRFTVRDPIDWRDPAVVSLGVLLAVNLVLLSSAIREGAVARTTVSLGVCYVIAVTMVASSRGLTDRDGFAAALSGGLALAVALAFVAARTTEYAVVAAAFGGCTLYYCWRLVRWSTIAD